MRSKSILLISIVFVFAIGITTYAQENTNISGIVTAFKIYPLNNVQIKSTKTGATVRSDSVGNFNINCTENDILLISAFGFDMKKIRIRKVQKLSVDLNYSNDETSFNDAVKNNHITSEYLLEGINLNNSKKGKDYSRYRNIYELIDNEIFSVKVSGTSVLSTKVISFSLTQQVLYVVDGLVAADISYILPSEVKTIEYVDGVSASIYGTAGANGVIKITLKK